MMDGQIQKHKLAFLSCKNKTKDQLKNYYWYFYNVKTKKNNEQLENEIKVCKSHSLNISTAVN